MSGAEGQRRGLLGCLLLSTALGCGEAQSPVDLASPPLADLAQAWPQRSSSVPAPAEPSPVDARVDALGPEMPPRPALIEDPIVFGATRKGEMAAYSLKHYGTSSWQLTPRQIVLHFTAGSTYASAFGVFAVDSPNRGELPGTCTHYVIDKNGDIYHLVDDTIQCRHTVGLNHVALGIEMVQETGVGASWADQQILARPAQIDAALRLVRWLQATHGIANEDVIGHAMANDSPFFTDLSGWVNDHSDWQSPDVLTFRSRLAPPP